MLWSLPLLALLLPLSVLAGKFNPRHMKAANANTALSCTQKAKNVTSGARQFKIKDFYRGQSFLDEWEFFAHPDPTHGNVNFQTKEDAMRKKLAYVRKADNVLVLKVDDFSEVPVGGNRDSVRINSKKTYNGGLFIADFWTMPHGCSVWPAYWSVGPNWPAGGEIDVLEGVHDGPTNSYTLHTSDGCAFPEHEASRAEKETHGSVLVHPICGSSGLDNRGCGFRDAEEQTYGSKFNIGRGGVYAHLWDSTGIKMWRFFRDNIPADIKSRKPDPTTWGRPAAFFPTTVCNVEKHFFEHQLIIDTTICGDLGRPTFAGSGCPGTCDQAIANATNFKDAKWQINYIAVYD